MRVKVVISHHGFCNFHPLFYMYMYKMCMETTKENLGTFHSTKKSGLNFGNFQERVEQHFPKFPKRGQPREVYPNFGKLFPGSFLSIQFCFRNFLNFRLSGSHNGKFNSFGNFSWEFLYHLLLFPNFWNFWFIEWKAPFVNWYLTINE